MPRLFDIQKGFVEALKNPDLPVPATLKTIRKTLPKRRFDVYRNNVAVGMIEALRATFSAVERLVGAEFFSAAAKVYIEQDPPRSPLLFRYGSSFGDFLEGFSPAASTPYLGDVARLEWARLEAYHAEDRDPIAIDVLSDVPQAEVGTVSFELHPSLRLLKSRWPAASLWAASTDRGSSDDVDINRPEDALIIRPALEVDTRLLPIGGFSFIAALNGGASLENAAVQASGVCADFDLAEHLQGLFDIGAVTSISRERP